MKGTTLVTFVFAGMILVFSLVGCGEDKTEINTSLGDMKIKTTDKKRTVSDNNSNDANSVDDKNTTGDKQITIDDANNKVVISNEGKTATYKTADGATEGELNMSGITKLPEGYPHNLVPVYKEAKIILAQKVKDEASNKDGYSITYSIDKDKQEVVNKYKDLLKDSKDFTELSTPGHIIIGVKDGFQISVMISDNMTGEKEKTSVIIGLTPYLE